MAFRPAVRSREIAVSVTERPSDKTWHINIYVDRSPYKSMQFDYPVKLLEAMNIAAVEMRLGADFKEE